jgi:hypothetical protein
VIARAEGYEVERRELEITGRALRRVVIKMWKVGERTVPPSKLGRYLVYGGLGAGVAGAAAHVLWYRGNLDRLRQAREEYDLRTYRSVEPAYDVSRWTTIGLYALGGAAVIAGGILHVRSGGRRAETAVTVLPRPEGGGVVAVGWVR